MKKYVVMLSLVLVLCAVVCFSALKADAATVASGTCGAEGDNLTWTLDDQGTLTILGTGTMADWCVSTDGEIFWNPTPWERYRSIIKCVVIGEGVTSIGDEAFCYMDLSSVTIPDSITSIGYNAFYGCSNLETIYIPDSVISIGEDAFEGTAWECNQPDGVIYAGKVAYGYNGSCPAYLEFKDGTLGIASEAFFNRTNLITVIIPDSVIMIDYGAFYSCENLSSIRFEGDAPTFHSRCFATVKATVYYPLNNDSWTEAVMQNYGGTITWVPYEDVEKFDIDASRMNLENALEFQFGVDKEKIEDLTGVYAVIEKEWADGSVSQEVIPATQWSNAGKYWAIVYDGLAAKEMTDLFHVTIYNAKGQAISNTYTESVRDYAMDKMTYDNMEFKTMLVDMLHYGAASQQKFNYKTDDLADALLTPEQLSWGGTMKELKNGQIKGDFYQGTRLVLENRIQMQVAFSGVTKGMYATYTYTDHAGVQQTETVKFEDMICIGVDTYGISLDKLVVADARQLVTVIVYTADGQVHGGAIDSIESYCKRSSVFMPLSLVLMQFSDSAYAYFH